MRVREDERDLIRRVAETDGKSMSDWAREVLVREAKRRAGVKTRSAKGRAPRGEAKDKK